MKHRMQGMGQIYPITVYKYVMKDSIEEVNCTSHYAISLTLSVTAQCLEDDLTDTNRFVAAPHEIVEAT